MSDIERHATHFVQSSRVVKRTSGKSRYPKRLHYSRSVVDPVVTVLPRSPCVSTTIRRVQLRFRWQVSRGVWHRLLFRPPEAHNTSPKLACLDAWSLTPRERTRIFHLTNFDVHSISGSVLAHLFFPRLPSFEVLRRIERRMFGPFIVCRTDIPRPVIGWEATGYCAWGSA